MIQDATDSTVPASEDRLMELAQAVLTGGSAGGTSGGQLTREEARELAAIDIHSDAIYDLFFWANKIRISFVGQAGQVLLDRRRQGRGVQRRLRLLRQSKHYKTHVTPSKIERRGDAAGRRAGHRPTAPSASASSTPAAARPTASWTGWSRSSTRPPSRARSAPAPPSAS